MSSTVTTYNLLQQCLIRPIDLITADNKIRGIVRLLDRRKWCLRRTSFGINLLFGQSHFNSYELLFKTIYDILVKTIGKTEILE